MEKALHLAFDEIRIAGAGWPQVSRRLMAALMDLSSIVPADRRAIVDDHVQLLVSATNTAMSDERDVEMAPREDGAGIGVAAGPDERTDPGTMARGGSARNGHRADIL